MKLNPLDDRLIIKKVEEESSVIIRPDGAKETSLVGFVIEAGPDCSLKVGDKILFARYSWYALPWQKRTHKYHGMFIMNEGDVLCLINESEEK